VIKVFCFFFSKKKTSLASNGPAPQGFFLPAKRIAAVNFRFPFTCHFSNR